MLSRTICSQRCDILCTRDTLRTVNINNSDAKSVKAGRNRRVNAKKCINVHIFAAETEKDSNI